MYFDSACNHSSCQSYGTVATMAWAGEKSIFDSSKFRNPSTDSVENRIQELCAGYHLAYWSWIWYDNVGGLGEHQNDAVWVSFCFYALAAAGVLCFHFVRPAVCPNVCRGPTSVRPHAELRWRWSAMLATMTVGQHAVHFCASTNSSACLKSVIQILLRGHHTIAGSLRLSHFVFFAMRTAENARPILTNNGSKVEAHRSAQGCAFRGLNNIPLYWGGGKSSQKKFWGRECECCCEDIQLSNLNDKNSNPYSYKLNTTKLIIWHFYKGYPTAIGPS